MVGEGAPLSPSSGDYDSTKGNNILVKHQEIMRSAIRNGGRGRNGEVTGGARVVVDGAR